MRRAIEVSQRAGAAWCRLFPSSIRALGFLDQKDYVDFAEAGEKIGRHVWQAPDVRVYALALGANAQRRLRAYALFRGYKPGWVYYRLRDQRGPALL
jgi:hypothetical protein